MTSCLLEVAEQGCISDILLSLSNNDESMIDFTAQGTHAGVSLLFLLLQLPFATEEDIRRIFQGVVHHIETHPRDTVHWASGDFIAQVARLHLLSVMYPIVKGMPYFGDRVEPMVLPLVWRSDWEGLEEEDRKAFQILDEGRGIVVGNRATAQLFGIYLSSRIEVAAVRRYVRDGAYLLFGEEVSHVPILLWWLENHETSACINAALEELSTPLVSAHWSEEKVQREVRHSLFHNLFFSGKEREHILRTVSTILSKEREKVLEFNASSSPSLS